MKIGVRIITFLLVVCLVAGHIPPVAAFAAETPAEDAQSVETQPGEDDGLALRIAGEGSEIEDFYGISTFSRAITVNHNPKFADYEIQHGVDISHHNGKVDWKKVKAAGYDFAIIRVAGRGWGSAGTLFEDNNWETNLKGAKEAGLEVGVYIFSQAITVAEGKAEAAYILNLIKGYEIDLPVVIDYEYTAVSEGGRLHAAKLKDRQRTDICKAFCEDVEDAGYEAMVYANRSMLENDMYSSELAAAGYETWLAEWGTQASYEGDYTYWQYTSDGSVNGVASERVDLNYRYIAPRIEATSRTHDSITLEWKPIDGADGYIIYKENEAGEFVELVRTEFDALGFVDSGLEMATGYKYKLGYYTVDEEGNVTDHESGYADLTAYTSVKFAAMTLSGSAVDAGTVNLKWGAAELADGYQIQYYNSSKKAYVTAKTITSGTTTSWNHSGLKIATTYKYRIRPYKKVNGEAIYGSWSAVKSVKTGSSLKKPTLTAKASSYTTNKLSWTKIPGAEGYKVQRYDKSSKKYKTIKTIKSGSTCSYSNTYLDAKKTYKYRVRAYAKVSGKTVYSSYSKVMSAKTKGNRTGKVKCSKLNVRKGPGTKYGKLTQVKKNKKLTVTGSRSGWYKVKIKVKGKYKTGYVSKSYVKLVK